MATIDAHHDEGLELTLFLVRGRLSADDLVRATEIHYGGRPTSNAIWDLTLSDLSDLDIRGLMQVSEAAKTYGGKRGNPHTLIVVEERQAVVIARLYEQVAEIGGSPTRYDIVQSLDEAYARLGTADPFEGRTSAAR
jgi:hypothetical protein